jgi:ribosomal protein S18 acetylase RimI-like enzyme
MPTVRPYARKDWRAVLDVCLLAFAPACESLGGRRGVALDWKDAMGRYLRSLIRPGNKRSFLVAEIRGSLVGFVHYDVDPETRSGSIGVSAVHPARQGQGIGSLLYRHALDAMRAQRLQYAVADTSTDASHAAVRRAYEKAGFVGRPAVHYVVNLDDSSSGFFGHATAAGDEARRPRRRRGRRSKTR